MADDAAATDALRGRVVVVTGGGRGIGRSTASLASSLGAVVVLNDAGLTSAGTTPDRSIADDAAAAIAASTGNVVVPSAHDLRDRSAAEALLSLAVETGGVDALIHCAGQIGEEVPAAANTPEVVEQLALDAVRMVCNVVTPALVEMQKVGRGRIVLVSSGTAVFGTRNHSAYAAGKIAALGLAKGITSELLGTDDDIAVNVALPIARTRLADIDGLPAPDGIAPALVAMALPSFAGTGDVFSMAGGRIQRVAFSLTEEASDCTDVERALAAINGLRAQPGRFEPRTMTEAMELRLGVAGVF